MACKECLQNCGKIIPDGCVEYTGDEIPAFGICPGDPLTKVEKAITDALLSALDGTGITPAEVTLENCTWLKDLFVGKSATLPNLLQLLIDGDCTLKAAIDAINTQLAGSSTTSFNTLCLTGLGSNPTKDEILQAVILNFCSLKTTVDAIPATYVQKTDLTSQVTQILQSLGLVGGTVVYASYFPKKVALPYFGDLSVFDNTGAGTGSFLGIYLCNGLNGTPDLRGRAVIGAVRNVPGGALDPAVDPALITNPNTNWALNDKAGEYYHLLNLVETPAHTHGVTDNGHTHSIVGLNKAAGDGSNVVGTEPGGFSKTTTNSKANIIINSAGGGAAHNNIQPSIAAYWIIRL